MGNFHCCHQQPHAICTKTKPDCSQTYTVVGWEATVMCHIKETFSEISGRKHHEGVKTLKRVVLRCSGAFTLGVIQSSTGHRSEQPNVC